MLNSVMSALDGFRNKAQLVEAKTYTRLVFEGIEIDVSKRLVYRDKREINVTCIEFEILYLLARNPGRVFSKEQIYDFVWKESYSGDYNIVMSHIRNIREKIEAGTALVEMCKEIKTVNAPAVIGEYAGFKMAVSFDAFNHKFVMNLKGQLSHNLEVGSDPLGNISRINHALESMPKQLMEAQTKLETVEHQLETAKVEVTKPFEQEAELAEKLERLSALNALLNMDKKGNDGIDMDDEPEAPKSEKEVADRPAKNIPIAEKTVGTEQDMGIRQYADAPAERVSLKAKLEVMKAKVAGGDTEKPMPLKAKGKEETL